MIFRKKFEYSLNDLIPLSTPLNRLSCTVVDTETTGFLVSKSDRLIEIGATTIIHEKLDEEKSFHTYIDPKKKIPEDIIKLTGIDNEKVLHAPNAKNGIYSLFRFIENNESSCIIGHYISFDLKVFKHELQREKLNFSNPKTIDTFDLIQFLYPTWDYKDLHDYARIFNVKSFKRHTALGDALTTAHLYKKLIQEIQNRGYKTWGELLYELRKQNNFIG